MPAAACSQLDPAARSLPSRSARAACRVGVLSIGHTHGDHRDLVVAHAPARVDQRLDSLKVRTQPPTRLGHRPHRRVVVEQHHEVAHVRPDVAGQDVGAVPQQAGETFEAEPWVGPPGRAPRLGTGTTRQAVGARGRVLRGSGHRSWHFPFGHAWVNTRLKSPEREWVSGATPVLGPMPCLGAIRAGQCRTAAGYPRSMLDPGNDLRLVARCPRLRIPMVVTSRPRRVRAGCCGAAKSPVVKPGMGDRGEAWAKATGRTIRAAE